LAPGKINEKAGRGVVVADRIAKAGTATFIARVKESAGSGHAGLETCLPPTPLRIAARSARHKRMTLTALPLGRRWSVSETDRQPVVHLRDAKENKIDKGLRQAALHALAVDAFRRFHTGCRRGVVVHT
jgi:hypothetical protein